MKAAGCGRPKMTSRSTFSGYNAARNLHAVWRYHEFLSNRRRPSMRLPNDLYFVRCSIWRIFAATLDCLSL